MEKHLRYWHDCSFLKGFIWLFSSMLLKHLINDNYGAVMQLEPILLKALNIWSYCGSLKTLLWRANVLWFYSYLSKWFLDFGVWHHFLGACKMPHKMPLSILCVHGWFESGRGLSACLKACGWRFVKCAMHGGINSMKWTVWPWPVSINQQPQLCDETYETSYLQGGAHFHLIGSSCFCTCTFSEILRKINSNLRLL